MNLSSASALAREIGEEIGWKKTIGRQFTRADFDIVASMVTTDLSGREIAVDIWKLRSNVGEMIHLAAILEHQRNQKKQLAALQQKLASALSDEQKKGVQESIRDLKDKIACPPIRIRRWLGLWMMFRWSLAPPFLRVRPNWHNFSPFASFALMMDATLLERRPNGGKEAPECW